DVLAENNIDVAMGGARRDEEKSRAKERVFSVRDSLGQWDPKNQRPEFWNLYNVRLAQGQTLRVFPLSNWTELDVWQYIHRESIPVVPLYFAKRRRVIVRNGQILPLHPLISDSLGQDVQERVCRFRTLGCMPCTGAVDSKASNVPEIIQEMMTVRNS